MTGHHRAPGWVIIAVLLVRVFWPMARIAAILILPAIDVAAGAMAMASLFQYGGEFGIFLAVAISFATSALQQTIWSIALSKRFPDPPLLLFCGSMMVADTVGDTSLVTALVTGQSQARFVPQDPQSLPGIIWWVLAPILAVLTAFNEFIVASLLRQLQRSGGSRYQGKEN